MLGFINDCIEKYVLSTFGDDTWNAVKEETGCDAKNDSFLKLENYHDESAVVLVEATSELTGLPIPVIYRNVGVYFVHYIVQEGYENLLCCQGHTLKEWMAGINAIHGHLQQTLPNKMKMPEFWCEENADGTLALFYMSTRGSYLAPLAEGIVTEVAKRQFKLDITMSLVSTQGEEGARFTSWVVATVNPEELPRLRVETAALNHATVDDNHMAGMKCPMSGMVINAHYPADSTDGTSETASVTECSLADSSSSKNTRLASNQKKSCPFGGVQSGRQGSVSSKMSNNSGHSRSGYSLGSGGELEPGTFESGSLSASTTQKLFPYHVVIDSDFAISQVGMNLPKSLSTKESLLRNYDVDEVFEFVQPKPAKWTRSWMRKLEDQEFTLKCILDSAPANVVFKGTLVATNPGEAMLVLCPEASNLEQLRLMNLTMSDLPAHGAYRDVIFLREHLSRQLNNALKMEKLSKTLQTEKELLESLLPQHAAEGLRRGETVKPRVHHNVTLFFSDIVGFTNICKHIDPTEVVDMLNRLYMLMDFLAGRFNLFKIETIGDAYVAASGLPDSDVNHAANVANFAVAVSYCCQRVLSPLDGSPIKLRIGVNSGRCASGIVGVTNPRYCVFGDTVNTTARHEGTGEAGKIHSSMTTMIELLKRAPDDFLHDSRGMIEMKGKGAIPTYWLSSTEDNRLTNPDMLKSLDAEILQKFKDMLKQEDCIARRKAKKASAPVAAQDAPPAAAAGITFAPDVQASLASDEVSCDGSTSDFNSSSTSFASSSMPSPLGVSTRSSYTPSRFELLQMLGGFLDGDAYDEVVPGDEDGTDNPSIGSLPLTNVVDEALRILDDED